MAIKKGDLVIGALWSDGDTKDPWYIGFYDGLNEAIGRHSIVDDKGDQARFGGFRRVEPIKQSSARIMLDNVSKVDQLAGASVFTLAAMTAKKLRETIK